MKNFDKLNPIVSFCYFVLISAICMFSSDPIVISTALVGAVLNFTFLSQKATFKSEIGYFVFFIVMALINPLFSHNGTTVLLVVNDRPITLEAIFYGLFSSALVVAVIYMFRLFSHFMTEDKLLYVFGSAFPRLSLILSGALRYTSLLSQRRKKVESAQRAVGAYGHDSLYEKIKGSLRVFSSLASWSLENGIITADSMSARGYGIGRRTSFSLFRFEIVDLIFSLISSLFGVVVIAGNLLSVTEFAYYPTIKIPEINAFSIVIYLSYALLVLMPTFFKISEVIRWKYLRSRI